MAHLYDRDNKLARDNDKTTDLSETIEKSGEVIYVEPGPHFQAPILDPVELEEPPTGDESD